MTKFSLRNCGFDPTHHFYLADDCFARGDHSAWLRPIFHVNGDNTCFNHRSNGTGNIERTTENRYQYPPAKANRRRQ
jgi:hypothetical protein